MGRDFSPDNTLSRSSQSNQEAPPGTPRRAQISTGGIDWGSTGGNVREKLFV